MANYVSGQRPNHSPIFAFAPNETVARRITLNWGTVPFVVPFMAPSDQAIPAAEALLIQRGLVHAGDRLVIVSDAPGGESLFDAIQLRQVGAPSKHA
jgi:pyruvate kinase